MFNRDIVKLPQVISREDFVNIVFDFALEQNNEYTTVVLAVTIGDRFVGAKNERIIYNFDKNQDSIMKQLVLQIYSKELAYVCVNLASKTIESTGSNVFTSLISHELENKYVFKMEWEILTTLNYDIYKSNFMTTISKIIWNTDLTLKNKNTNITKHSVFNYLLWELCRDVCLDPIMMNFNPFTILLGWVMLFRKNKLKASKRVRYHHFNLLLTKISEDYDLSIDEILKELLEFNTKV